MTNHCSKCGKFLSVDGIKCKKCSKLFHRQCVKINNDGRAPGRWVCTKCLSKPAGSRNVSPLSSGSGSANEDVGGTLETSLAAEIKLLRLEMSSVCQEMTSFRQEVSKLNSNIEEFNKRLNSVEERVNTFENRLIELESKTNSESNLDVATELLTHIDKVEQDAYCNDVEIAGIVERSGEDPTYLVTQVAQSIGISLDQRDVIYVERRGKRRSEDGSEGAGMAARPLVVRLARRAARDQLLRAARARRDANVAQIVPGAEPRRFYINERLTRINRQLFYGVRMQLKNAGWKFIWVKNAHILARRDVGQRVYSIRSMNELSGLVSDTECN